jgi:hypothetical protein
VRLLINHDADLNAKDRVSISAVVYAARSADLLERPHRRVATRRSSSPLSRATLVLFSYFSKRVQTLKTRMWCEPCLKPTAESHSRQNHFTSLQDGNSALYLTAYNGHTDVIALLIKAQASLETRDKVQQDSPAALRVCAT